MLHKHLLFECAHAAHTCPYERTYTFAVIRKIPGLGQGFSRGDQSKLGMAVKPTGLLAGRNRASGRIRARRAGARRDAGREQALEEGFAAETRRGDRGSARDDHTALCH